MNAPVDKQVIEYGIDKLDALEGTEIDRSELHHHLYNTDYFIIGTSRAKRFLEEVGTFDAIGLVQQYEQDNFGEVSTDLTNPEKVANMYAYIVGEQALANCDELYESDNDILTEEQLATIKKQLEAQL